jgi:hypothetical protein
MNKIFTFLFFIIFSSGLYAQTGSVRGFVFERESGEPIIFTNVFLEGTSIGTSTDVNGYYSITKVKPGTYTLVVSGISYEAYKEEIKIEEDKILTKKIHLKSSAIIMDEFTVAGERQESKTKVKMSLTSVSTREIASIPTVGGQADIAQYMQVIPGVVFTGDQGGQLYIRGGTPVQNRVLLDGMTITQPFHSIGLFSVFDNDLMRNADIYTGGFDATYGERISSVIDITMRNGNKNKTHGVVGLNTFGARASIEGPIKKPKSGDDGAITYVLSIKDSYLDQTSKILYPYINDGEGLPFDYTDLFAKISFSGGSGSVFNLKGFSFTDRVRFNEESEINWINWGAGGDFMLVPATSPSLLQGRFNYSKYTIDLREQNNDPRSSDITNFDLGLDFKYFIKKNELKYGFDITGLSTTFNSFSSFGIPVKQTSNTTNLSVYGLYQFLLADDKLVIDAGIRMIFYSSISFFSFEPRIGFKYNITPLFRFKASWGVYTQNIVATNSDRDVVNLFYGYVTSPESITKSITNENGTVTDFKHSIQKAVHYIAGFEYDINEFMNINIEGYFKNYPQLINSNRHKLFDQTNTEVPDVLKTDFFIETGTVYGVDFIYKFQDRKNFVWLVYSFSKSDRWDGFVAYNPVYDRRHNVNLVYSRKFGKRDSWEANIRWNFGSGFPFTQTAGFYQPENLTDGIYTDITTSNSTDVGLVLGELNQGRLPAYTRLDIGFKKSFFFKGKSKLVVDFGVTNVLNRSNVFFVDRFTGEIVNQLPFLPALGVKFYF